MNSPKFQVGDLVKVNSIDSTAYYKVAAAYLVTEDDISRYRIPYFLYTLQGVFNKGDSATRVPEDRIRELTDAEERIIGLLYG